MARRRWSTRASGAVSKHQAKCRGRIECAIGAAVSWAGAAAASASSSSRGEPRVRSCGGCYRGVAATSGQRAGALQRAREQHVVLEVHVLHDLALEVGEAEVERAPRATRVR